MDNLVIEATYPISFRQDDAKALGKYLAGRHSVMLIGMKRVGISNFLRFFLYHKDVISAYISKTEKHLFIPVDLNDLVERETFPFWMLTLKRIVDEAESSPLIDKKIKKEIETLFLDSIQSKNLFLLIDNVRQSMLRIIQSGVLPTLFFLRFDRMKDAITHEFFDNLQGLKDATHQKLSYVITSFRDLTALSPEVFTKSSLLMFAHDMYMQPAKHTDVEIVANMYKNQYDQKLPMGLDKELFGIVDGYIRYLQLALISLRQQRVLGQDKEALFSCLSEDEQITLQSEELWESLEKPEQDVLIKVIKKEIIPEEHRKMARYIWDTGLLLETRKSIQIFSPLFSYFIRQKLEKGKKENGMELTKKEHLLLSFLEMHVNEICEREKIIAAVWPEVTTLGVTDWAVDRLVARVRNKLKQKQSGQKIETIKTRGYKLVSSV